MYTSFAAPIFAVAPLAYLSVGILPGAGSTSTLIVRADGAPVLSLVVSQDQLGDLAMAASMDPVALVESFEDLDDIDAAHDEALEEEESREAWAAYCADWDDIQADPYSEDFDYGNPDTDAYGLAGWL